MSDVEHRILLLLASGRKRIFFAQNIYEAIWYEPYFYTASNAVLVHIQKLRTKIEPPQTPWQRGTNGLIRQYFSEKFDFLSVSQSHVDAIVSLLNNRPGKVLGFAALFDVFLSSCYT